MGPTREGPATRPRRVVARRKNHPSPIVYSVLRSGGTGRSPRRSGNERASTGSRTESGTSRGTRRRRSGTWARTIRRRARRAGQSSIKCPFLTLEIASVVKHPRHHTAHVSRRCTRRSDTVTQTRSARTFTPGFCKKISGPALCCRGRPTVICLAHRRGRPAPLSAFFLDLV